MKFIQTILIILCAMLHISGYSQTSKPNIIFILADDQGYGDLGSFGSDTIKTPNIDSLAKEGMTFTDFYVHNICTPSRMAFMTGAYANRIELSRVLYWGDRMGLHQDEITTAEILKEAGYATSIIGKWHLGAWDEFHPNQHGFDHFFGFWGYTRGKKGLVRNNEVLEDIAKVTHGDHSPKLVNEAIHFIEQNKNKPFFLFYSSPLPHFPFLPSDRFKGSSQQGAYGDQVQDLDWQVGEILKTLDKHQLTDNTLVIYTSDNGPQLTGKFHGSTAGLRDGKWSNFEGGIRVPMLARWPAKIAPATQNTEITSIIDMLPTFSSVAGGQIPTDRIIDGKNLMPYFEAQKLDSPLHETFIIPGKTIRYKNWKLAFTAIQPGGPKSALNGRNGVKKGTLFNLEEDVEETTDVSDKHPEIVKMLTQKMNVFMKELHENRKPIGKAASYTDKIYQLEWQYIRTPAKKQQQKAEILKQIHQELAKNGHKPR